MKPTYTRTWPSQPPVRKFGTAPSVITDTKDTAFDGNSDPKLAKSALFKQRMKTLKKHGKGAYRKTFKVQ